MFLIKSKIVWESSEKFVDKYYTGVRGPLSLFNKILRKYSITSD